MTFETIPLPHGIRSRFVSNGNGLTVHVLEAGFEGQDRPCVLLLHGFPELAYSWRTVMVPLAAGAVICWTGRATGCSKSSRDK
jgi:pimeloyl-ACP methyl ester carboxylesterase